MVTTTKCPACGKSRVLESMIQGIWVCRWCYDNHTPDKEWEDGDDSALYDDGYRAGVRDAVALINDNEKMSISYQNVLNAITIRTIFEEIA